MSGPVTVSRDCGSTAKAGIACGIAYSVGIETMVPQKAVGS